MKMEFDIEKMDDDTKRRFLICAIDGRRLREFTRDFSVINSRLKDLGEYDRDYRKEHKEELSASHDRIAQDALSEFDKTGEESTKRLYGADWEKYIEMEKKLLEMYDRGEIQLPE